MTSAQVSDVVTFHEREFVRGVTSVGDVVALRERRDEGPSTPHRREQPVLRIEVLGAMQVWLDDEPIVLKQAQQRAILALLVLGEHAPVTPERLIQTLWAGEPPVSARNVVHTQVKRLRHAFEPHRTSRTRSTVLASAGDGYVLQRGYVSVDLWQFRSLVRRAAQARSDHDDAAVFALLAEATALWRDAPFADVATIRDSAPARALGEQYACAVGWYAEAGIRTGRAAEVLGLVEQAAHARPLDEAAQALLMRTYHATARRSDAFAVHRRTRQALAEELGVDPGHELRRAYEALLQDVPSAGSVPLDQANLSRLMLQVLLALGLEPSTIPASVGRRAAVLQDHLDVVSDVRTRLPTAI